MPDVPIFAGLSLATPIVMGVLNITPDSFSDGGDYNSTDAARRRAEELCQSGAKIIDVGGESTRPGAAPISTDEEITRILPVLTAIKPIAAQYGVKISVDTRWAAVMQAAVNAGADIINDVSALTDDAAAFGFVTQKHLPVILMHKQGDPLTMQDAPTYKNAPQEIYDFLQTRVATCLSAGLTAEHLAIDPGLGFGKTLAHNVQILQQLNLYAQSAVPLLVGASRKGMIGALSGNPNPKDRLGGSIAAALYAITQGAKIIRAHDVKETVQAIAVWQALQTA